MHTLGMEDLENRGKEECLHRLTHKLPSVNPTQHCPILLWVSSILTSVSSGDVMGNCSGCPVRHPWTSRSSFLLGTSYHSLVNWPAILLRKVSTLVIRSMKNQCLCQHLDQPPQECPSLSGTPINRPWVKASWRCWAIAVYILIWRHELLCCFSLPQSREKKYWGWHSVLMCRFNDNFK